MAKNGISTLPTKEERQLAKLELAQTKRQLTGIPGRPLKYYDIDLLPTRYSGNTVVNNPNVGGLVQGRPWKTTPNIVSGLWRTTYDGYFNDGGSQGDLSETAVAWFDTTNVDIIESIEVTDFSIPEGNIISCQWLGYFRAPHTANYTFYSESDDEAYFWIGNKAVTGYTAANADTYSWAGGPEVSTDPIELTEGQYYPIRLQYGNAGGEAFLNFSWEDDYSTNPTITIGDLTNVTSGPVSGNTYTNGGGYDYAVFGSATALTGAIINFYSITPDNSSFFHAYPVTWAPGSDSTSGYVYLQVTSTGDFQFYSSDIDGNPLAGTWIFPMRFEAL
jgi:GLEYA domain